MLFFTPVCNPSNNYGFAWGSGEWGPPAGNKQGNLVFSSTPAECCAACYTTTNCAFYFFFEESCTLTTFGGGPITNPYNTLCPNGLAGFNFTPGDYFQPPQNVFGEGPCSGPFT
jgi:hypothetical protein